MQITNVSGLFHSPQSPQKQANAQEAVPTVFTAGAQELSPEEQRIVQKLQQTDREVRAHEQAHKAAGAGYTSSASFQTTTGPDGRQYAVAGEVSIDTSSVPGNPEATIRKLDIVIRAALAPAQPSSQDFAVARAAQSARQQAQAELNNLRAAEISDESQRSLLEIASAPKGEEKSVQAQQLETLLEGIDSVQNSNAQTRGTFFDAIN